MLINEDWQTQARGSNEDEYRIYVANASSLGWMVRDYQEWSNN